MEGLKKSGSSSFDSELFGSSESLRSSSSSSTGIFSTMFPLPATAKRSQHRDWGSKKGSSGMDQQEKSQPCHLSSSLYYGGQAIYSSTSSTTNSAGAPSSVILDTKLHVATRPSTTPELSVKTKSEYQTNNSVSSNF